MSIELDITWNINEGLTNGQGSGTVLPLWQFHSKAVQDESYLQGLHDNIIHDYLPPWIWFHGNGGEGSTHGFTANVRSQSSTSITYYVYCINIVQTTSVYLRDNNVVTFWHNFWIDSVLFEFHIWQIFIIIICSFTFSLRLEFEFLGEFLVQLGLNFIVIRNKWFSFRS